MNVALAGNGVDEIRWGPAVLRAGGTVHRSDGSRIAAVDAAIVGGDSAAVLQAARTLDPRTPLLVLPTAAGADAVAYALLPDVDDGRPLFPGWTARRSAAVAEYRQRFARGDLGDIQLIQFERTEPPSAARKSDLIPTVVVHERFFEDVDLLRLIGGDYNRVTAVAVGAESDGCRRMTVTLGAEGAAESLWTLSLGASRGWRLTITTMRGPIEMQCREGQPITLRLDAADVPLPSTDETAATAAWFLEAASSPYAPDSEAPPPRSAWDDYVRAADLLGGLQRSLRRRRTIDLHFESTSERSQFKTQMTAIGCGVLTWTFLGTCLGLVLGSSLDPRDSTERRAAAAETILWEEDFPDGGLALAAESEQRLVDRVRREGDSAIVLIEHTGKPGLNGTDSDRLSAVEKLLRQSDDTRRAQITVRPLSGRWFRGLMLAIWLATFVPLGLFLGLQLLLAVARGAKSPATRP